MSQKNNQSDLKIRYFMNRHPLLDVPALFSDGSEYYRKPSQPQAGDTVTVRFRTRVGNVSGVSMVLGETSLEMTLAETKEGFDYYEASFVMPETEISYYFEILFEADRKICYGTDGPVPDSTGISEFQVFPGFTTPEWAKGAVMYQIFTDRFCNGDPANDVETDEYSYIHSHSRKAEDWNSYPEISDISRFYGGDLQGIIDKLDYLQELGVEVLYLNPIFVSPSNHKYDIQDYDHVDPHFGKIVEDCEGLLEPGDENNAHGKKYLKRVTDLKNLEAGNEMFASLVQELHRRGMRLILDGVFNHCGSFNKWMDRERIYEDQPGYEKGAYVSKDSPYRSFFQFENDKWPYNESYDGWWGHKTLPKLNYEESEELYDTVLRIGKKWVSEPYNVDGWRLDVAADLGHSPEANHKFWKDFRKAVKEANPDAVILAEHYGDPSSWLSGDEWDTVMNYDAFMEPVTWFLTGMEKHSDEYREELYGNSEAFIGAMKANMRRLHMTALYSAMNELSNHDHSRFLTRTNRTVGRIDNAGPEAASMNIEPAVMREAVAIQMTWPGCPTIYYGDEAGVCGFTDPDSRRTYPWGHEDRKMLEFHKCMVKIHKDYPFLRTGSVVFLWNDLHGLSYARFTDSEQMIVVLNNMSQSREVEVDTCGAGIQREEDTVLTRILLSDQEDFTTEEAVCSAKAGIIRVMVPPRCVMILYHRNT